MLRPCLWSRLSCQLDSLAPILSDAPENIIVAPGSARSWSAHHHLAHLGRLHEVMLERIRRVLCEDDPLIAEYRTEDDTETLQWTALSTRELLARLQAVRGELLGQVRGLSEEQLRRGPSTPGSAACRSRCGSRGSASPKRTTPPWPRAASRGPCAAPA